MAVPTRRESLSSPDAVALHEMQQTHPLSVVFCPCWSDHVEARLVIRIPVNSTPRLHHSSPEQAAINAQAGLCSGVWWERTSATGLRRPQKCLLATSPYMRACQRQRIVANGSAAPCWLRACLQLAMQLLSLRSSPIICVAYQPSAPTTPPYPLKRVCGTSGQCPSIGMHLHGSQTSCDTASCPEQMHRSESRRTTLTVSSAPRG